MFAWIGKRANASWSRRTRWTPLLQNQREFQRTLSKERSRVDRIGGLFGFIILRLKVLDNARGQTQQLARLLHRRLRETDEKGHLGIGRIGVMLPATDSAATQFVMDDIVRLAAIQGLRIDAEAFVYPEQEGDTKLPGRHEEQSTGRAQTLSAVPLAMMVPAYPRWKRALDVTGASVGLLVSSPFLLSCAALIKITSPGPVLFCQQRTGYLGQPFTIFKLRTMVVNAADLQAKLREKNERDGPAFKMLKDPRITLLGKFLRATGLDELPQLYNVLRGDMSLVGPRPLPIDEAEQCKPWQKRRADAKPGLTCFWQLAKSRKISFVDWMRLDLQYSRNTSIGLDVRLIAKTFASVFLGRVGH